MPRFAALGETPPVLTGHARLAGILGWPVRHSRSPRLHGLWLQRHGVDGAYVPLPVAPDRFASAVRALADLGFRGANVTIPHKEAAFAVCDRVDALLDAGCPGITLVNRTRARAEALAGALGGPITVATSPPLSDATMIVNTTSQGMQGQPAIDLDLAALPSEAIVADIVYVPRETPLLCGARMRGLATVEGLGMLLHQARPGFEAWFGVTPQVDQELRDFVGGDIPLR